MAPAPEEKNDEKPEATGDSTPETPEESEELSPEEQMARYEESLKDTDWGHQPC